MTRQQIEEHYLQYDRLLHKLSIQCSRRCGRPKEECYGQACYLFMLATRDYDPGRNAAFGTFLFRCVSNGLVLWGKKNDLPPEPEFIEQVTTIDPSRAMDVKDWVGTLSEECREVATVILNGPAEMLELGGGKLTKITARTIRNYLLNKGWGWIKTRRTIRDLKRAVATL